MPPRGIKKHKTLAQTEGAASLRAWESFREALREALCVSTVDHPRKGARDATAPRAAPRPKFFDRCLSDAQKGFEAGNFWALVDVLFLCFEFQQPLPHWTKIWLLRVFRTFAHETVPGRKLLRRYRTDLTNLERFLAVKDLLERGVKWWNVHAEVAKARKDGTDKRAVEAGYKLVQGAMNRRLYPYRYLHGPGALFLALAATQMPPRGWRQKHASAADQPQKLNRRSSADEPLVDPRKGFLLSSLSKKR